MQNYLYASIAALLLTEALPATAQEYDRHGHALILDAEGWLYVDRAQRPVLRPFIFDNGPDYYVEGLARFVDNGKMGFHDEALRVVVPAQYDFVYPFENGVASAGSGCRVHRHSEHSYVTCQHWQSLRHPSGPTD